MAAQSGKQGLLNRSIEDNRIDETLRESSLFLFESLIYIKLSSFYNFLIIERIKI